MTGGGATSGGLIGGGAASGGYRWRRGHGVHAAQAALRVDSNTRLMKNTKPYEAIS